MVGSQGHQGSFVGGILSGLGLLGTIAEFQNVEEHLAELAGRIDVELRARHPADGSFEIDNFL